jgi:hypothetical protein
MAYPSEVAKGDTVRFRDYLSGDQIEGVVVRVAADGTWAEVRIPHSPHVFAEVTHVNRGVRVTRLSLVAKAPTPQ